MPAIFASLERPPGASAPLARMLSTAEIDPGGEDFSARLLAALNAGQARMVIGLIPTIYAAGMSIAAICDGPIHQAIQAIGNRWPHDKKAIFIEHRARLLLFHLTCC